MKDDPEIKQLEAFLIKTALPDFDELFLKLLYSIDRKPGELMYTPPPSP